MLYFYKKKKGQLTQVCISIHAQGVCFVLNYFLVALHKSNSWICCTLPSWLSCKSEQHWYIPCRGTRRKPSPAYTCQRRRHPQPHRSALHTSLVPWILAYLHNTKEDDVWCLAKDGEQNGAHGAGLQEAVSDWIRLSRMGKEGTNKEISGAFVLTLIWEAAKGKGNCTNNGYVKLVWHTLPSPWRLCGDKSWLCYKEKQKKQKTKRTRIRRQKTLHEVHHKWTYAENICPLPPPQKGTRQTDYEIVVHFDQSQQKFQFHAMHLLST